MTSIPRFVCIDCGKPVSAPHVKRCRSCYQNMVDKSPRKTRTRSACRICGAPLSGRYKDNLCPKCHREQNFKCIDCGGQKSTKHVLRCRKCNTRHRNDMATIRPKSAPVCIDCGAPLPNRKRSGVCSPCERRRIAQSHVCEVCGGEVSTTKTKVCRKCIQSLSKHPTCQKCGKTLANSDARLCGACYAKYRVGANNPNWKGKTICPSCGGRKNDQSDICIHCQRSTYKGLPKCKNCGKNLSRYKPQSGKGGGEYCRACYRGNRTVRWNHDLTLTERMVQRHIDGYPEWRMQVFVRDNFTCQKCAYGKGGKLVAHHIISYKTHPNLRLEVSNGITLCRRCHIDFHRRYGQTNNTPDQLSDFMRVR